MRVLTRFFNFISICILAYACQEKNDDEKNNPPASPTLVAPNDAAENIGISPVLVWECSDPDEDMITYSIYFSANNPPDSIVISNHSTANYTITGLEFF